MRSEMNNISDTNFKNLFLEFFRPLCLFSTQIVGDIDIAKDIVQDVFVDIWDKRERIDFEQPIKPLLYKYTRNKSIDYLRKSSSQEGRLNDWLDSNSLENFVCNMYMFEQEGELHFKNLETEIVVCVEELSAQCKKIFNLSRVDGLRNREIAEKLGITVKAVEKQMTKALSTIRDHLQIKGFLTFIFFFFMF